MNMVPDMLAPILAQLLHAVLVLLVAPMLLACLDWGRARLAGYRPPSVTLQVLATLAPLRQRPVLADGVSAVFRHAPVARLAVLLGAAVLVPGFATGMALTPVADLLAVAGLLALARGIEICAALDAGGAQAGQSAALLLRRGMWLEAGLVLAAFALAALGEATAAGSTGLDTIVAAARDAPAALRAGALPVVLALAALALAEIGGATLAGGGPVFGPDAWQGACGGRDLAVLRLGSALRALVWLDLLGALLLPAALVPAAAPLDWPLGIVLWVARLALLAVVLLAVTVPRAGTWPDRVLDLPAASLPLALLGLVMLLALAGRA